MHGSKSYISICLAFILLLSGLQATAQNSEGGSALQISGKVIDAEGEPLPGASIYEKKQPKFGTVTDIDGNFRMSANGKTSVQLIIQFVGMKRQEVTWHGKPLKIVMERDENKFDDVVVTGYQVIDKRASTSAITSIKAEDIIRPDALSIDQMLEGQIPDLMYMSNSGEARVAPRYVSEEHRQSSVTVSRFGLSTE